MEGSAEEIIKKPRRPRKKKSTNPERRPYMDGFTASRTLEDLYQIGTDDVEKEILKKFPKKLWFTESPLTPPPYSQFNGAAKDNQGIHWGRRSEEPDMLNVRLPVARKFDTEGRVVTFPEPNTIHQVEGIGKFIVEDVIVPEGRRITAQIKVKWLE
jgi:hypothetical protein